MCPACNQPNRACTCRQGAALPSGPVRVRLDRVKRRGKDVTVIEGLPLDPAKLAKLAKRLKRQCGSGGTAKDGVIVIQGDHCEQVTGSLREAGFLDATPRGPA